MNPTTPAAPSPDARPWRLWVRPVLFGVLLGWLVASAVTGLAARTHLGEAQRQLNAAEDRVRDLDVAGALTATREAGVSLVAADKRLDAPHLTPWRLVPIASRNLRVGRVMTDEAMALATSAESLLAQADTVITAATDRPVGDPLPVGAVRDLAVPLQALADRADEAERTVLALDSGALIPPLRSAFGVFTRQARETADQAGTAATSASVAATLLGADGPQRLFVAAVTPAELRGSGGVIGAWSVMELDDGAFSFQPFNRIFDLVIESVGTDVAAPNDDFADRWGQYDAMADWRNTTMTPDVPSAATVMEELWDEINPSQPIDGVLLVDPTAFEVLAQDAGALRLSDGLTIPADEIVDFVTNEAYVVLPDDRARREAIGEVATASLQQLVDQLQSGDVASTLSELARLFTTGNSSLHLRDAALQSQIVDLGISGGLVDREGDEIGLALNNGAGNKVDYWLEQQWRVRVAPTRGGSSLTTMDLTLTNGAPDAGYTQEVLGPFVDTLGAGDTLLLSSVYCGPTCQFRDGPSGATTDRELGFGVNDHWSELASGATTDLAWTFVQDDAWSLAGGIYRHEVHVAVPATVQDPDVIIEVKLPATVIPVDLPPEATLRGDTVTWRPGRGSSTLVVTNAGPRATPSFLSALRRPTSALF